MCCPNGWSRLTHVLICSLSNQAATEVEPSLALTHVADALGLVERDRVISLEKVEADRKDSLAEVEAGESAARRQRGRKQLIAFRDSFASYSRQNRAPPKSPRFEHWLMKFRDVEQQCFSSHWPPARQGRTHVKSSTGSQSKSLIRDEDPILVAISASCSKT
jgi:hypothetical protein